MATPSLPKTPYRFAWRASRGLYGLLFTAVALVITATCLEGVHHYVIKLFTDALTAYAEQPDATLDAVWLWAMAYAAIYMVTQILWRGSGFCGMRWITGLEAKTYSLLFTYLTGHSKAFFEKRFSGSLANKISNAGQGLDDLLGRTLWGFFPFVLGMVSNLVIAYLAHWSFAAIFVGWFILFAIVDALLVRRQYHYSYKAAETNSAMKGRIVDSSTNIAAVQQGGHHRYEQRYVGDYIEENRAAHLSSWQYMEIILLLNGLLLSLFAFAVMAMAVYLLRTREITVGEVMMLISMMVAMKRSIFFIGMHAVHAMRTYGQVREGLDALVVPHDISDKKTAEAIEVSSGAISFENVTFAYDQNIVFNNFSLHIPAGQKVGLVGASGAGKSTLVSLLLRQYESAKGQIRIDEQDINEVTLESLRKSIGLVPQDVSLFHRTVKENILYGRLDADDQEIQDAARAALAAEFIETFPNSYDTYVGERGVRLSGGQRQRVAIARAYLKDAPILILDEATSALDSQSEAAVQKALENLFEGRTVIAIAHRLSTLRQMDRIIVLKDGRVSEDGTHEELVKGGGLYAKLWKSQVRGFVQDDALAA